MADTTSKYNLRYPEDGDNIDAKQIEDLANDVEATFDSRTAVSATHTVSLQNGWQANPNNPLVFERVGDVVFFRGEVYNSSAGADPHVGTVPNAFRPTFERVGPFPVYSRTVSNVAQGMIWDDGRVTISGFSAIGTTPGYGLYGSYVRAL